ncbi:hypothetical protein [Kitasatospora sp. NBC_01266]|uniref:hypothetical protein n=1 Tax=Kitasatospora sp. NBC_01266 TaxID=2903572 RepID=UPI002E2EF142|nr:hypothetical protein [Kitasatospora sp. NBC_01266]
MLSAFRPVHRTAVLLAVTALTALPMAAPARADAAPTGQADAVTAELKLDVSLLNNAVDVPVDIALNKVESPGAAQHGALLSATVAGVAQPGPITLLKADIGSSVTHLDAQGASAAVQLLNADVHAPGLPGSTLLGLQALSSSVSCPVDGQPTATVNMPAQLSVLGHQVNLRVDGSTQVDVPAIGSVDIEFAQHSTTSTTAAAAALSVHVVLNPLNLNVAKVDGTITVASVSCVKPGAAASPSSASSASSSSSPSASSSSSATGSPASSGSGSAASPGSAAAATTPAAAEVADAGSPAVPATAQTPAATPTTRPTTAALAFTGATGIVPLLIAAAALIALGAAAVFVARRRGAAHRR